MSVEETELTNGIENLLQSFPLGKSEDEIQSEFSDHEDDEVAQALESLETDGNVLKVGDSYRWTG